MYTREEWFYTIKKSGGIVVCVPATRPSVPVSNLGPGLPTEWSEVAADHTVILYKSCNKILGPGGL